MFTVQCCHKRTRRAPVWVLERTTAVDLRLALGEGLSSDASWSLAGSASRVKISGPLPPGRADAGGRELST